MTAEHLFRIARRHQSWLLPLLGIFVALASFFAWSLLNPSKSSAVTTTPTTMNFQGRLTDSSGVPMPNGSYNMKFRLFTVSSGGTDVWNELRETTNRVQVTNGLFSTRLGDVTPLSASVFTNSTLYFEIELPTPGTATCSTASCATFTEGAMTPRSVVATSAFAFNAEALDGIDSSQFARNDTANTLVGAQTIQGTTLVQTTSATALVVKNTANTKTPLVVDTNSGHVTLAGEVVVSGSSSNTFDVDTGDIILNSSSGSGAVALLNTGITAYMYPTSLVVQDPSTSVDLLTANASNDQIQIGSATTNATAVTLVLDSYNTAADPTGTNGGMYYNTATHTFRCYRDSNWENCGVNPIDRGFVVQDEFLGGCNTNIAGTNGTFAELGWSRSTIGADGSFNCNASNPTPTADHPGVFYIVTTAVANQGSTLTLGNSNNPSVLIGSTYSLKETVAVDSATNVVMRTGLHTETTTTTQSVSGVWWEADPATNANWRYCYGNGTTATCANSATAVAQHAWVRLEIRVTATGTNTSAATFTINGTSSSVSGVTIDTTNRVYPAHTCYTTTTASRTCYLDYFQLRGIASAAR